MKKSKLIAEGLSISGIVVSIYALWLHYQPGPAFCNISERISCDLVNKGPWSEILGMPVAAIGFMGYGALAFLIAFRFDYWPRFTLLVTAIGFAFGAWLTYLEIFVIHAVCPVCMLSLTLITALSVVLSVNAIRRQRLSTADLS